MRTVYMYCTHVPINLGEMLTPTCTSTSIRMPTTCILCTDVHIHVHEWDTCTVHVHSQQLVWYNMTSHLI